MEKEAKFSSGDLVVLVSGGPVMTVEARCSISLAMGKSEYNCQWFNGKRLENGRFPETSLKPHTEQK